MSIIPSTSTASASRRKSTSPSIPLLRNNSKMSILSLAIVALLNIESVLTHKDDAVALLIPLHLLLHHITGHY